MARWKNPATKGPLFIPPLYFLGNPLPRKHEHEHRNDDVEGDHVDPDVGGEGRGEGEQVLRRGLLLLVQNTHS